MISLFKNLKKNRKNDRKSAVRKENAEEHAVGKKDDALLEKLSEMSLQDLILASKALNDAKKTQWLNHLKKLNREQKAELRAIFEREQKGLKEIRKKAFQRKIEAAKKLLEKIKEFKHTYMPKLRRVQEKKSMKEDKEKEAALLKNLEAV